MGWVAKKTWALFFLRRVQYFHKNPCYWREFAFEDVLGLLQFIIYIVQYPQYKAHESSSTPSNKILKKPVLLTFETNYYQAKWAFKVSLHWLSTPQLSLLQPLSNVYSVWKLSKHQNLNQHISPPKLQTSPLHSRTKIYTKSNQLHKFLPLLKRWSSKISENHRLPPKFL